MIAEYRARFLLSLFCSSYIWFFIVFVLNHELNWNFVFMFFPLFCGFAIYLFAFPTDGIIGDSLANRLETAIINAFIVKYT